MGNKVKATNMHRKAVFFKRGAPHIVSGFARFSLFKSKRAASPVVANLILIAAVLAIGLIALAYTRSSSINYQSEYGQAISSDINKLKESITFQYVFYNSDTESLYLYLLNSGAVDVELKSVSIGSSDVEFTMYQMSDTQGQSITKIQKGLEVRLVSEDLSSLNLQSNTVYSVKLTTRSDSNFAHNFMA